MDCHREPTVKASRSKDWPSVLAPLVSLGGHRSTLKYATAGVSCSRNDQIDHKIRLDQERAKASWARHQYTTIPSLEELAQMTDNQKSAVLDFTVANQFGEIHFPGVTDLLGVVLEETVLIEARKIEVYGSSHSNIPVGQKLNRPARLKFFGLRVAKGTPNFHKVRAQARNQGAELLNYLQETGELTINVSHFTKYQFQDLDTEEEPEPSPRALRNPGGSLAVRHQPTTLRTLSGIAGRQEPTAATGLAQPVNDIPKNAVQQLVGDPTLLSKESLDQIGKNFNSIQTMNKGQSSFVERFQGSKLVDSHLVGAHLSGHPVHASFPIGKQSEHAEEKDMAHLSDLEIKTLQMVEWVEAEQKVAKVSLGVSSSQPTESQKPDRGLEALFKKITKSASELNRTYQGLADNDGKFDIPTGSLNGFLLKEFGLLSSFKVQKIQTTETIQKDRTAANTAKVLEDTLRQLVSTLSDTCTGATALVNQDVGKKLVRFCLLFGLNLWKSKLQEWIYFELFNLLFGLPKLRITKLNSSTTVEELDELIIAEDTKFQKDPSAVVEASRRRALTHFLQSQVLKNQRTPGNTELVSDCSLDVLRSDMIKTPFLNKLQAVGDALDTREDWLNSPSGLYDHYHHDFFPFFLSLLLFKDTSQSLEKIFELAETQCNKQPKLTKQGQETLYWLIQSASRSKANQPKLLATSPINPQVDPLILGVLRWQLATHLVEDNSSRISPLQCDIQPEQALAAAVASIGDKLNAKEHKISVLILLHLFPSHGAETIESLCVLAAKHLANHGADKELLKKAGISTKILEQAVGGYLLAERHYEKAVDSFIAAEEPLHAFDLFLRYEAPILVPEQPIQFLNRLSQVIRAIKDPKIGFLSILETYIQLKDFSSSQTDVSWEILAIYFKELFSKISHRSQYSGEQLRVVSHVVSETIDLLKNLRLAAGDRQSARDLLYLLSTNSNLKSLICFDWQTGESLLRQLGS